MDACSAEEEVLRSGKVANAVSYSGQVVSSPSFVSRRPIDCEIKFEIFLRHHSVEVELLALLVEMHCVRLVVVEAEVHKELREVGRLKINSTLTSSTLMYFTSRGLLLE